MWDYTKTLAYYSFLHSARWENLIMRVILHVCSLHGENVTPRISSWTWRAWRWKQFVGPECSFCTVNDLHSSTQRRRLLFNQLYIEWSRVRRGDVTFQRKTLSYTHQVNLYHRRLRGSTQRLSLPQKTLLLKASSWSRRYFCDIVTSHYVSMSHICWLRRVWADQSQQTGYSGGRGLKETGAKPERGKQEDGAANFLSTYKLLQA